MDDRAHPPMASYRLQFNRDFRFTDAQALAPYFSRLGVTHVYSSPVLRSRQSSTHGYDVVDPATINPNLGDKNDLVKLVHALKNYGLALVLDIVPNHMAASLENPYWRDVLTYGHSSPFARWFDVDWRMPDPNMWGRVLVPILGEPRTRILSQDLLKLAWDEGRFLVTYYEHVFPVDPATIPAICEFGLPELEAELPADHPALDQIQEILSRLRALPRHAARVRRRVDVDRDEIEHWLAQFAQIVVHSPAVERWAEETAQRFTAGPKGRERLRKLLDAQPYRLVHWRDAARTINYRRFFDVNELISIRQEDPQVFSDTHSAVLRWIADGLVDGLRIDHIDGLRDPLGYLERLVEAVSENRSGQEPVRIFVEKILAPDESLPCGWPVAGTTGYEFLNQVEALFVARAGFAEIEQQYRKIVRKPAQFPQLAEWGKRRVLNNDLSPQVGRLADGLLRLAESHHAAAVAAAERDAGDSAVALSELAPAGKLTTGESTAAWPADPSDSEKESPSVERQPHELKKREMVDAIVEFVVALPIYRTYVDSTHCCVSDADRRYISEALAQAQRTERASPAALEFLGNVLLLANCGQLNEHQLRDHVQFVERFQQLTGPAAAKGIEDTALYAYVPLVSLNEVGGEPQLPEADTVEHLHNANAERAKTWPHTMLCVSTHDTKRTADVRARLDVLSEIPDAWTSTVRWWMRVNRSHRVAVGDRMYPDASMEYLFYQTLIGLWPAPDPAAPSVLPDADQLASIRGRIEEYVLKAAREAKTYTSWTNNNQNYENSLVAFVRAVLAADSVPQTPFLEHVHEFVGRVVRPGFWNSLARTLIQFTSPGTPDLYQGDEIWNFALVDPDNRRPVDYELRSRLLDDVCTGAEGADDVRRNFVRGLVETPEDGRIKLHVVRSALEARRKHPRLFSDSDYIPLRTAGPWHDYAFAYAIHVKDRSSAQAEVDRSGVSMPDSEAMIVIVPRFTTRLVDNPLDAPVARGVWGETAVRLPDAWRNRSWRCAMTHERIAAAPDGMLAVADALETFPVALLFLEQD